jgi:hypothetical protein
MALPGTIYRGAEVPTGVVVFIMTESPAISEALASLTIYEAAGRNWKGPFFRHDEGSIWAFCQEYGLYEKLIIPILGPPKPVSGFGFLVVYVGDPLTREAKMGDSSELCDFTVTYNGTASLVMKRIMEWVFQHYRSDGLIPSRTYMRTKLTKVSGNERMKTRKEFGHIDGEPPKLPDSAITSPDLKDSFVKRKEGENIDDFSKRNYDAFCSKLGQIGVKIGGNESDRKRLVGAVSQTFGGYTNGLLRVCCLRYIYQGFMKNAEDFSARIAEVNAVMDVMYEIRRKAGVTIRRLGVFDVKQQTAIFQTTTGDKLTQMMRIPLVHQIDQKAKPKVNEGEAKKEKNKRRRERRKAKKEAEGKSGVVAKKEGGEKKQPVPKKEKIALPLPSNVPNGVGTYLLANGSDGTKKKRQRKKKKQKTDSGKEQVGAVNASLAVSPPVAQQAQAPRAPGLSKKQLSSI